MTHVHFAGSLGSGGSIWSSIKRAIAIVATLCVAALVIMAAGIVAIATAIVGLIIAFAAMLMRAGAYKRPKTAKARSQTVSSEGVLEARRTARGWTVDK
jgi:hypothetical protein